MTIKAVFWNTNLTDATAGKRAETRAAVQEFAAQHFNQVAVSGLDKAETEAGLRETGILNSMVYVQDGQEAESRGLTREVNAAAFTEALASLNQRGVIAKQPVIAPHECLAITDNKDAAREATRAGMQAISTPEPDARVRGFIKDLIAHNRAPR